MTKTDPPPTPTDAEPSTRAFCHTVGFLFESVGFILILGTCCWWSFAWWYDAEVPTAHGETVPQVFTDAPAGAIWEMIAVPTTLVGGMVLVALGMGLMNDRLRTGRGATLLTAAFALFFWSYLIAAVASFPSTGRIVMSAVMAVGWTGLFLLAGAAGRVLQKHPPPNPLEQPWTQRDEDDLRKEASPH